MEFQLGQTYSGYEFLDIRKRSKSGIEYRVRNTRAGRLEALRALPENAQEDQERSERFLREMRVHASLLHPNIITVFAAMDLESHLVMTTELVEGPTLADRLKLGPIPPTEAVALIRQVLSALSCAHQAQVVHRDLSPDNIVITPAGTLKLANFGLAKGADSPKLTQVGMMVGNMKYISPEQVKGVGEVDARSDLYSAGMVLYEMLCGRPAFTCESQFELMAAQVVQAPVSPDEVNPAVPKELAKVVLRALAKDPGARYQTAAEFDEAIGWASGAASALPSRPAEPEVRPSFVPPPTPPRILGEPAAALAVPSFLAASTPPVSWPLGLAAGTCLGALAAAIWFFAK